MFHSLVDAISSSAWAYPIIFAVAFLDSFFPVVPSETVVITGGVLAGSGGLRLELVIVAAALGAWLGDNFAYLLGHLFGEPLERRMLRGERAQKTLRWVRRQLEERGGELIVIARFIPGGRTATTMTCGVVGYPWRRFVAFSAAGGVGWALYGGLIGYLGGRTFRDQPWKGLLIAFAIAGTVTLTIELVRHFRRRGETTS